VERERIEMNNEAKKGIADGLLDLFTERMRPTRLQFRSIDVSV